MGKFSGTVVVSDFRRLGHLHVAALDPCSHTKASRLSRIC